MYEEVSQGAGTYINFTKLLMLKFDCKTIKKNGKKICSIYTLIFYNGGGDWIKGMNSLRFDRNPMSRIMYKSVVRYK